MNQRHPLPLLLLFILLGSLSHAAITDSANSLETPSTNTSSVPSTITGSTSTNDTSTNDTDRSLIEPDPNPNNSTDTNSGVDGGINGSESPAADIPPIQNPSANGTDTLWPTAQGANNKNLTKHIAAIVGGALAATAVATGAAVGIAYLVKNKQRKRSVGAGGPTPENTFLKSQIEHVHRDGNNVDQNPRNVGQKHSRGSTMVPDHRKGAFWMGDKVGFDSFHNHMGNQPLKRPEIFRNQDKNRQFRQPFGRDFVDRHKHGRQDWTGRQASYMSVRENSRHRGWQDGNGEIERLIEENRTFDRIRPRLYDYKLGYQGGFKVKTDKERNKENKQWQERQRAMTQNNKKARGTGKEEGRGRQFEQIGDRPRAPSQTQARVSFRGRSGRGSSLSSESQATFSEHASVSSQLHRQSRRRNNIDFGQPRGGIGVRGAIGRGNISLEQPSTRGRFGFWRWQAGGLSGPSGGLTGQVPSVETPSTRGRFGLGRRARWLKSDRQSQSGRGEQTASIELQQVRQQTRRGRGLGFFRRRRGGNAGDNQNEDQREHVTPPPYRAHFGQNQQGSPPPSPSSQHEDQREHVTPPPYRIHFGVNQSLYRQAYRQPLSSGSQQDYV